jgi:pyridoxamine 5'-phosphate oxidase
MTSGSFRTAALDHTTAEPGGLRGLLRALPVLAGAAPDFDPAAAPPGPVALFAQWLAIAVDRGVREPHAMTVATVSPDGQPDARVLILKDVDAAGWHFGASSASQKGADLAARPAAALTFYWPELVRQVRVRGPVVADPPSVSAADFRARSAGSRAMVLTGRQSQPLQAAADLDRAVDRARRELAADPGLVPDEWISWAVRPDRVEFWQGDPERRHQRLRYEPDPARPGGWTRALLWP